MGVKPLPEKFTCPVCKLIVTLDDQGRIPEHQSSCLDAEPCVASGEQVTWADDEPDRAVDAAELLVALTRRQTLLEFVKKQDLAYRIWSERHPDHPKAVEFVLGGEHWVAAYSEEGFFKHLMWRS